MKRLTFLLAAFVFFGAVSFAKTNDKYDVAFVETSKGTIAFVLLKETPLHLANFKKRVDEKYYNNMLFHRIIRNFVIQTGDPGTKNPTVSRSEYGQGGHPDKIAPEFVPGIYHTIGAVGMAREGDDANPGKLSSASHFYIVQGKNKVTKEMLDASEARMGTTYSPETRHSYTRDGGQPRLDGAYTVFGYVIDGMEVVDAIADVAKNSRDVPYQNIVIKDIKIKQLSKQQLEKKYSYYAK